MPRPVRPTRLLAPLLAATLVTCSDGVGPVPQGDQVLVANGYPPYELTALDGRTGIVTDRLSVSDYAGSATLSPDRSVAYVQAGGLLAMDTRSHAILWRAAAPDSATPADGGEGVRIAGYGVVGVSPDGQRLVVGGSRGDSSGLVVLDAPTGEILAFVGSVPQPTAIVTVPARPGAPGGALLLVGYRPLPDVQPKQWIYTLDPATLAIRDSAAILDDTTEWGRHLDYPTLASDGRHLYVMAYTNEQACICRYDLDARRVTDSLPLRGNRPTRFTVTGQSVYVARYTPYYAPVPGPTWLTSYTEQLAPRDSVPLSDIDGMPLNVNAMVGSPAGTRLYIAGGTPPGVIRAQPGALLALDPVSLRTDWNRRLGKWLPLGIYVW